MRNAEQKKRAARGIRELKFVLRCMEANSGIGSQSEGERAICAVCTAELQPCRDNPFYECSERNLGETQLSWLVRKQKEESNGHPAACSMCGKTLTTRQLRSTVLRELCPSCRAKSARIQCGDVRKGNES